MGDKLQPIVIADVGTTVSIGTDIDQPIGVITETRQKIGEFGLYVQRGTLATLAELHATVEFIPDQTEPVEVFIQIGRRLAEEPLGQQELIIYETSQEIIPEAGIQTIDISTMDGTEFPFSRTNEYYAYTIYALADAPAAGIISKYRSRKLKKKVINSNRPKPLQVQTLLNKVSCSCMSIAKNS